MKRMHAQVASLHPDHFIKDRERAMLARTPCKAVAAKLKLSRKQTRNMLVLWKLGWYEIETRDFADLIGNSPSTAWSSLSMLVSYGLAKFTPGDTPKCPRRVSLTPKGVTVAERIAIHHGLADPVTGEPV